MRVLFNKNVDPAWGRFYYRHGFMVMFYDEAKPDQFNHLWRIDLAIEWQQGKDDYYPLLWYIQKHHIDSWVFMVLTNDWQPPKPNPGYKGFLKKGWKDEKILEFLKLRNDYDTGNVTFVL